MAKKKKFPFYTKPEHMDEVPKVEPEGFWDGRAKKSAETVLEELRSGKSKSIADACKACKMEPTWEVTRYVLGALFGIPECR